MELNDYAVRLFNTLEEVNALKLFGDSAKLSRTEFRLLREVVSERSKGRDIISSERGDALGDLPARHETRGARHLGPHVRPGR